MTPIRFGVRFSGPVGREPPPVDLVELEEERADHILRDLTGGELGEVGGFDAQRSVHIYLHALHGGGDDRLGCRHGAVRLLGQHRRDGGHHHARLANGAARDDVSLGIKGLRAGRVFGNPGLGLSQHLHGVIGQLVQQTCVECLFGAQLAALGEQRQRGRETDHPHGAHHATAAGQQAQGDLG